jgi:hypothetical protein
MRVKRPLAYHEWHETTRGDSHDFGRYCGLCEALSQVDKQMRAVASVYKAGRGENIKMPLRAIRRRLTKRIEELEACTLKTDTA